MSNRPSLSALIFAYFEKHPNVELSHNDWVDEISQQYQTLTGRMPRDPWRATRKLYEEGKLQKVRKGVYKYDPNLVYDAKLEEFTEQQKQEILTRGNHRCAVCGKGRANGVELHIDHIIPKIRGGRATIDNGQVLCSQHNFVKKNLDATESGKRLFINLYGLAKSENNRQILTFCHEVLDIFEKYDINGHIEWTP